jgi:hypothetical protein
MEMLRNVIGSLVLACFVGLGVGCGPDLENPGVMTTEDSPEEQALYEEMEAEMEQLLEEEEADY